MLSAGLWHMLHVTDAAGYAQDLRRMRAAIAAFRSSLKVPRPHAAPTAPCTRRLHAGSRRGVCPVPSRAHVARCKQVPVTPPMSFFSVSEVYPPKLKTEDKRLHLTLANVDAYNRAINDSGVLVPGGPLYLIDVHHLTQGAPRRPLLTAQGASHAAESQTRLQLVRLSKSAEALPDLAPVLMCTRAQACSLHAPAGCGPSCTHDGLHYSNATYDAAFQIWANNLLSVTKS